MFVIAVLVSGAAFLSQRLQLYELCVVRRFSTALIYSASGQSLVLPGHFSSIEKLCSCTMKQKIVMLEKLKRQRNYVMTVQPFSQSIWDENFLFINKVVDLMRRFQLRREGDSVLNLSPSVEQNLVRFHLGFSLLLRRSTQQDTGLGQMQR